VTFKCRENPTPGPLSRLGRIPRLPASLLALALGTMVLALASCGGKDAQLLPGETAREITANLDTVQQLSAEGDCAGAESAAQQVGEQIEALEGVDAKLKRALEEGAGRLNEVIATCEESPTEAISPAVVPTEIESSEEGAPKEKEKAKEKQPKEEAPTPETPNPPSSLPPQANGEGPETEPGPPSGEEGSEEGSDESPSGGVGPGSPAEEGK
jgi:hypothetical protein